MFASGALRGNSVEGVGGDGANGYIRSDVVTAGRFILPVIPTLAITSIGGLQVPALPTGTGDVTLPTNAPNPVNVTVAAANVPLSSVVKLTLKPLRGVPVSVNSGALTGSVFAGTVFRIAVLDPRCGVSFVRRSVGQGMEHGGLCIVRHHARVAYRRCAHF